MRRALLLLAVLVAPVLAYAQGIGPAVGYVSHAATGTYRTPRPGHDGVALGIVAEQAGGRLSVLAAPGDAKLLDVAVTFEMGRLLQRRAFFVPVHLSGTYRRLSGDSLEWNVQTLGIAAGVGTERGPVTATVVGGASYATARFGEASGLHLLAEASVRVTRPISRRRALFAIATARAQRWDLGRVRFGNDESAALYDARDASVLLSVGVRF